MLNKILSLLIPILLPWLLAWIVDKLRGRQSPFDNGNVIDVSVKKRQWWNSRKTVILFGCGILLLFISLGYAAQHNVKF